VKLVLQCAVCGTNHAVGTTECATCRATGLANLRLLFECPGCFAVGLTPRCEACNPSPPPLPYEVVEGPGESGGAVLVPDFEDEPDEDGDGTGSDAFELIFDDEDSDDTDEDVELRIEDE